MHTCTNDLQIHNIIQNLDKSCTWKKTLHRAPQGPHTAVLRLIKHDNFVNSGLLTNAMVL